MSKWKQIWRRRPRLAVMLGLFSIVMLTIAFGAINSISPAHHHSNALAAYPDAVGTGQAAVANVPIAYPKGVGSGWQAITAGKSPGTMIAATAYRTPAPRWFAHFTS